MTEPTTIPRDAIDLTRLRPVASVIMDGGRNAPIMVYDTNTANDSGYVPRGFYVDTPYCPVIVYETTIRKAVKLALRNGGWG